MKKLSIIPLVLIAAIALAGCSEENNPVGVSGQDKVKPSERTTIVDVALAVNAESGEFSTLIAAVVAADLVDELLLTIEPIILGGGKTIFPGNGKALPFDLVSTEKASTGAQVCRYVRVR